MAQERFVGSLTANSDIQLILHSASTMKPYSVEKASPPMTRVISILEILEHILSHLDLQTLLVSAQRVNREWATLIKNSPTLQACLFLVPDEQAVGKTPNPLLAKAFPFCFEHLKLPPGATLPHISKTAPDGPAVIMDNVSMADIETFDSSQYIIARKDAFTRDYASWRKMLIQQPPIRALGYVVSTPILGDFEHAHKLLEVSKETDKPVTMEDLLYDTLCNDMLLAVMDGDTIDEKNCEKGMPEHAFRVLWHRVPGTLWSMIFSTPSSRAHDRVVATQIKHFGVVVEVITETRLKRETGFRPALVAVLDILFGTAFQGNSMSPERYERLERLMKFWKK